MKASSNVALQGRVATCEKLLKAADAAIAKIEALPAQKGKVKRIRLEELQ